MVVEVVEVVVEVMVEVTGRPALQCRYLTERCDQLCGKVQQVTALLGSKERRDTYT